MSFYSNTNAEARPVGVDLNAVMRQVYLWLTAGLVVCAGTAYFMAATGRTLGLFSNPIISIVLLIAYFVAVFALYPVVMRSSPAVGAIFYLGVTALLGIMLSTIFLEYKLGTIAFAFGATAATFGAMSVVGYTTKVDLSRFGSILMMAVFGLIIASIVNLLFAPGGPTGPLFWLINYAGVLIFTGLTAYDTQWIKKYSQQVAASGNPDMIQRIAIIGAFHLFLDFVNLFLFILRILGGGRGGYSRR